MKVEKVRVDSRGELIEIIRRLEQSSTVKAILLGKDGVSCKEAVLFTCTQEHSVERIGVLYDNYGIVPQCFLFHNKIWIGFSKEVDIVQNGILLQREETDSCFYEFRTTNDGDHLLCIFELAVFSFDEEGKKEWSFYAPDIITGYTLENGRFCVKTESGDFRIALATGAYRFQGDS